MDSRLTMHLPVIRKLCSRQALKILLLGALTSTGWEAAPVPFLRKPACQKLLSFSRQYVKDTVKTGGLRLILKPQVLDDDVRYFRFLSSARETKGFLAWILTEMPVRLAVGIKDMRLTPFRGFYYSFIQKPVGAVTQSLGRARLEPTLPVLMLLSTFAYQGVDNANRAAIDWKIQRQIKQNRPAYEMLIKYDFRFHDINNEWRDGEITEKQAMLESFWRKLAVDKYYQNRMDDTHRTTLNAEMQYLNFFTHLKNVIENGVGPEPGFIVPLSSMGRLNAEKVIGLFEINHRLFSEYQIIEEMTHNTDHFNYLKTEIGYRGIIDRISADPFTNKIIALWREKRISPDEAELILQEDAFWRSRFAEWKTIGVTRLKDEATKAPLTIQDIRDEIIQQYEESQHPAS